MLSPIPTSYRINQRNLDSYDGFIEKGTIDENYQNLQRVFEKQSVTHLVGLL